MNNLLFFQSTITKVVLKLAMSKSLTLMVNLDLKSQQGSTRDALTSARRLVDYQCTACTRNAPPASECISIPLSDQSTTFLRN